MSQSSGQVAPGRPSVGPGRHLLPTLAAPNRVLGAPLPGEDTSDNNPRRRRLSPPKALVCTIIIETVQNRRTRSSTGCTAGWLPCFPSLQASVLYSGGRQTPWVPQGHQRSQGTSPCVPMQLFSGFSCPFYEVDASAHLATVTSRGCSGPCTITHPLDMTGQTQGPSALMWQSGFPALGYGSMVGLVLRFMMRWFKSGTTGSDSGAPG